MDPVDESAVSTENKGSVANIRQWIVNLKFLKVDTADSFSGSIPKKRKKRTQRIHSADSSKIDGSVLKIDGSM